MPIRRINQVLREKFKVIEYKDGCIYKTQSLGEIWVAMDAPLYTPNENDEFLATLYWH